MLSREASTSLPAHEQAPVLAGCAPAPSLGLFVRFFDEAGVPAPPPHAAVTETQRFATPSPLSASNDADDEDPDVTRPERASSGRQTESRK